MDVHSIPIYSCENLKATKMPSSRQRINLVHLDKETIFSSLKRNELLSHRRHEIKMHITK